MSAASATVPSTPVVSLSAMGAGGRGPPASGPGSATPGKCCENGRPVTTDPLTGQTICSCQYNPGALLMAAGCYPRGMGVGVGVPGLAEAAGVYTSPYATAAIQGLIPTAPGAEHAAFYSSMGALQGAPGYYAYDPFGAYPYGNGFAMDPNARRKNATRESTQTLKAWLSEHRKNPYPTKGEKIMLAIITKMTLTQVSTWFANARRRLKKENKMTWSPRNRCGDDDDADDDDDDVDADVDAEKANAGGRGDGDGGDTNNNRDFVDDASENNDVDVLDCDDRSGLERDFVRSKVTSADDSSKDINVLDEDDDSGAPSGKDSNQEQINTSIGSAFTLVSPSRTSVRLNEHSPSPPGSPHLRHHPAFTHHSSDPERLPHPHNAPPKMASPVTSPAAPPKPKIWSVADVMAKSSRDEEAERARASPRSPAQLQMNGNHMPHPAFPTAPGGGGPPNAGMSIGRSMALWSPGVTSLPASRYHPYGMSAGLFSVPPAGGPGAPALPTSRAHFPGHGLPTSVVHNLIGPPHPAGLGLPAGVLNSAVMPTDLRKISPGSASRGHPPLGNPDEKCDVTKSRDSSPILPTAFKPVARSS